MFVEPEDKRHQYTMHIHWVTSQLVNDGRSHGDDGAWEIQGEVLRTYYDLVDFVVDRLQDEQGWDPPATVRRTINAFIRRLLSSHRPIGYLVRADIPLRARHTIRTSDAPVTVQLPASYSEAVTRDGLQFCEQLVVTRIGRGVVIHTAPEESDRLPIIIGYVDGFGQW